MVQRLRRERGAGFAERVKRWNVERRRSEER